MPANTYKFLSEANIACWTSEQHSNPKGAIFDEKTNSYNYEYIVIVISSWCTLVINLETI
jgi:hypothetical protein